MINDNRLSQKLIERVSSESVSMLCEKMGEEINNIILYGSCARGDFTEDSDIDIAVFTSCDRIEAKKYYDDLAEIATKFAMKYLVIINFVCIPQKEYEEKRKWYPYFKNIDKEGTVLYGR